MWTKKNSAQPMAHPTCLRFFLSKITDINSIFPSLSPSKHTPTSLSPLTLNSQDLDVVSIPCRRSSWERSIPTAPGSVWGRGWMASPLASSTDGHDPNNWSLQMHDWNYSENIYYVYTHGDHSEKKLVEKEVNFELFLPFPSKIPLTLAYMHVRISV